MFEWEFNRDIVRRIAAMLKADGVKFEILVPEESDVSLPDVADVQTLSMQIAGTTPYC